jgi:hypothetical protein
MSEHMNHGNEGSAKERVHADYPAKDPYWKRAHREVSFWIGLVLMLAAIGIYATYDDWALLLRHR